MSEFEGLGEVMSVANDNAASISFEGLVGNLLRAGAIDLAKLHEGFRYVPYEDLSEEVDRIQDVKVAFFERFWGPSGKDVVRTFAVAASEVGFLPCDFPLSFLLASDKVLLFAQEMVPDEPSEGDRAPGARRSPSGRNASGSLGAQV